MEDTRLHIKQIRGRGGRRTSCRRRQAWRSRRAVEDARRAVDNAGLYRRAVDDALSMVCPAPCTAFALETAYTLQTAYAPPTASAPRTASALAPQGRGGDRMPA